MKSKSLASVPLPVRGLLKKLGGDIADARKRRRISTITMCARTRVSRPTLRRIERGDPKVSFGIVATVLFVLGLHNRLSDLADASQDRLGLDLESEKLPQRIYGPRKRRDAPANISRGTHEPGS
jgi:transcriptional regulator with XRE-family HTH domain